VTEVRFFQQPGFNPLKLGEGFPEAVMELDCSEFLSLVQVDSVSSLASLHRNKKSQVGNV